MADTATLEAGTRQDHEWSPTLKDFKSGCVVAEKPVWWSRIPVSRGQLVVRAPTLELFRHLLDPMGLERWDPSVKSVEILPGSERAFRYTDRKVARYAALPGRGESQGG